MEHHKDVWAHHCFLQSTPTIAPSISLTNTSSNSRMIRHWWPWWQRRCSLTSTMRVWREWSNGASKMPSMNPIKTEEVIFGTVQHTPALVIIHDKPIKQSASFKYLGIHVDSVFCWSHHVDYICNKVQQRIYFLRRLRSFGASEDILHQFFTSTIQSILQYGGGQFGSVASQSS